MTESWARKHARENPGHRTFEGRRHEDDVPDPGSCDDCRSKSPAHFIVEPKKRREQEGDA